jgi:hypothetical protein
MHIIDTYLTFWPGGKKQADSITNMIGDQFFAMLGWMIAHIISNL